jgi:tellurite resistance protein
MKRTTMFATAVLALMFSTLSLSQTKTPVIDQREQNQQARINQGVQSGELTRGEARRLEAREGKIKAGEMVAKSDGKITPAERRHFKRELNRTSWRIYRNKHNARTSPQ